MKGKNIWRLCKTCGRQLETTQLYAQIRPAALKQAVEFYEAKALDLLSE